MAGGIVVALPQPDSDRVTAFKEFLVAVTQATTLADVNIAAGLCLERLEAEGVAAPPLSTPHMPLGGHRSDSKTKTA